jgi:hypothetical protein
MNRIVTISALVFLAMTGSALATVSTIYEYNFTPGANGNGLSDLNHDKYYKWGINWSLPQGQDLLDATFSVEKIKNWRTETNYLYLHLLPDATAGVTSYGDNQNTFYDNFLNGGNLPNKHLHTWQNIPATYIPLTYAFDSDPNDNGTEMAALATYVANGNFGIGLDPDCYYSDSGMKFQIRTIEYGTPPVPEPLTIVGAMMGLGGIGGYIRRRLA